MKLATDKRLFTKTNARGTEQRPSSAKSVILAVFIATVFFAAGCGSSIHDAQDFSPNEAPVIENVSSSSTSSSVSSGIKKGMKFTIAVTARDPEKQKLIYDFVSDYGTFGAVTVTATGCSVLFLTNGFVESGKPVSVKMIVKDTEGATAATSYNVGTGKRGPLVEVTFSSSRFIQSKNSTGINIRSNCEGIYQIYLDNGIPTDGSGAGMRSGFDYFRYKKASDNTFKTATAVIAGATNTDAADVKLSNTEQANRVWVVFSDGINEPVATLAETVVDNTAPAVVSIDPVNNLTGAGITHPVRATFNENIDPMSITNSSISVSDSSSFFPVSDAAGSCAGEGSVVTFTPVGFEYYSTYEAEIKSGIKDLAGNEYAGGGTSTFTTVDLGTTPVPQFNITSQTYDAPQNVSFVNTPSDTKILYTSAISTSPADPTTGAGSILYTTTPITVDRNTVIKAIAIQKGYRQSSVKDLSVKVRTPTPSLSASGTQYPTMQRVFSSDIVFTPNLNGYTLPSGESVTYYNSSSTNNGYNGVLTVSDPTTASPQFTSYTHTQNTYRIKLKLIAKSSNMEPSEIYESPEYRKRLLTLTSSEKSISENGYAVFTISGRGRVANNWTSITSSDNGKYLAATENSSHGTTGNIWTSDDYGLTWIVRNTSVAADWQHIDSSPNGQYIAASAKNGSNQQIYASINFGVTWNQLESVTGGGYFLLSIYNPNKLIAAQDEGSVVYDYNLALNSRSTSDHGFPIKAIDVSAGTIRSLFRYNTVSSNIYRSPFVGYTVTGITTAKPFFYDRSFSGIFAVTGYFGNTHGIYNNDSQNHIWITDTWAKIGDGSSIKTSAGDHSWTGLKISDDGAYVFATENSSGTSGTGGIHVNTNPASFTSWNNNIFNISSTTTTRAWTGITSDYTGENIAAITAGEDIWTGSGSGSNWNWSRQGLRTWTGIACSSDGKFIAACDGGAGAHGGYIHISTEGGTIWSMVKKDSGGNSMQKRWKSIAISRMAGAEGACVYAVETDGTIYRSMNYGVDWRFIVENNIGDWCKITTSQDGKYVYAGCFDHSGYDLIWKSDDYGDTFQLVDMGFGGEDSVTDIQCSASGKYVVFSRLEEMGGTSNVFYSSNYGTTFSSFSNNWNDEIRISLSSDGTVLFIGCNDGTMYSYTIEGGALTYNGSLTLSFTKVFELAMSNDGNLITAATDVGILTTVNGGLNWTTQTGIGTSGWNCVASTTDGLVIFAGGTKQRNITVLR